MSLTELSIEDRRVLWLSKHKGIIGHLANKFEVSRPFASMVWRGQMKSGERRIEKELARLGAPGFEQFLEAAEVVEPSAAVCSGPATE
jgi:hypothetical protein